MKIMKITRTRVEEGVAVQYDGTAKSMMEISRLFYDWNIRVDDRKGIYLAPAGRAGQHLAPGVWVIKMAGVSTPHFVMTLEALEPLGYSWEEEE